MIISETVFEHYALNITVTLSTVSLDNDRQKTAQRSHSDQCIKVNILNGIENPKHCCSGSPWPNLNNHRDSVD